MVIEVFLNNTPHWLEIVGTGDQAVEKITSGIHYDLVLMDIHMPGIDGLEATRQIRQWEKENQIKTTPIIALTAHAMVGDEAKSLMAGCNSHVPKPITKNKLLALIESL